MSIGIRNVVRSAADLAVTSSLTPVDSQLLAAITGTQTIVGHACFYFTVGATGGVRILPTLAGSGATGIFAFQLANTVAPSQAIGRVALGVAFANALANAGSHWIECDFTITGGALSATPFNFQFAQNTSDPLTATLQAGSWMEFTYL